MRRMRRMAGVCGVRVRDAAVELGGVVGVLALGCGRAHGDGDADLARFARQHLGLVLGGRRTLVGGAARALGRVLALALAAGPPQLLATLEALDEPRVQDVLLRLPRVVLRLPPFPFHVVLHFVLKREKCRRLKTYIHL